MSANEKATTSSSFDFHRVENGVNKYFESQLDSLGLSMNSIRRQPEKNLRRSLIVLNQAIENHESFGKFGVRLSADIGMLITTNKSETLFEIGILPLLLERYQLILKRLEEFDKKKKESSDETQIRTIAIRKELTEIAQGEVNRQFWLVIGALVGIWVVIYFLIQIFSWNVLEPWTYLLSIALLIGGYAYFAIKQHEFSPVGIYQQAFESRRKSLFRTFGVDES